MPGGDRTGPLGAGPLSGRGAGFCRGYGVPGYANPWRGAGRGAGYGQGGYGRGRRNRYFETGVPGWAYDRWSVSATPAIADERRALEDQAVCLRTELQEIERRLDELNARKDTEK